MIVISGCPRSGTSMMTHTIGELLKDEGYRIIGRKFPQEGRLQAHKRFNIDEQIEGESNENYALRKFLINKGIEDGDPRILKMKETADKQINAVKKIREMNKHGFWECQYTVKGCSYHIGIEEVMQHKNIAKIVSQGLPNTDPRFLDEGKVIMMVRNPREVAKSQEKLQNPTPEIQELIDADPDSKPHSPDMFNRVSLMAARWFKNSGIDPLIIDYDEFCLNHEHHIDRIIEYLGMGNKEKAMQVLDITQRRSKSAELDTAKFKLADKIYEKMLVKDWDGMLEIGQQQPENNGIQCVRMKQRLDETHCIECKKGGDFTKSCIKIAERKKIDWENLPCVYECGAGRDIEHIMVGESIKNNHWKAI